MNTLGTEDFFINPVRTRDLKSEIIPHGTVSGTSSIHQFRFEQNPIISGRKTYLRRDVSLGTEVRRRRRVMPSDIDQDICFDDVAGALLEDIDDKFHGTLKQKIIDDIKYAEVIETALQSESALAKDWLTPEEDEAWRDL